MKMVLDMDMGIDDAIAMAMAVLGLYANRPIQIDNVACVATSYPGFWDDMEKIAKHDK